MKTVQPDDATATREDSRASIDHLIREALAYDTGSKIKELFSFIGRTTVHSPYNAMLLHIQKPDAKLMLSATKWKELGRSVNAGARPYVILATMGPVSFVFDESDTKGDPLPENLQGNLFNDSFAVSGGLTPGVWKRLMKSCEKARIAVTDKAQRIGLAGQIAAKGALCEITINSAHPSDVRFVTMVHELAHLFCGHLGPFIGICQDRRDRSFAVNEVEAEATAFLVAMRLGLKSSSERYMSTYLQGETKASFSMDAVLVAAGRIEAMCKGKFRLRKKH